MEGESLLNDASGITLFTIFLEHVEDLIQGTEGHNTFWSVLGNIVGRTAWLGIGAHLRATHCWLLDICGWLQAADLLLCAEPQCCCRGCADGAGLRLSNLLHTQVHAHLRSEP